MERLKRLGTKNILLLAGGLIVVLLLAVGALFVKYSQLKKGSGGDTAATSKRIVTEVGNIFAVPTNEEPTVALVQDKTKLQDQHFFDGVENGDYILVYSGKKIAIIYREKENKLINVGPINLDNQNGPNNNVAGASTSVSNNQNTQNVSTKPKVAILNGTGDSAKLDRANNDIRAAATVNVIAATDAKNKNTASTVVVDVSGSHSDLARAIAQKLGGSVGSLPGGESAPAGADIIVIVGKK